MNKDTVTAIRDTLKNFPKVKVDAFLTEVISLEGIRPKLQDAKSTASHRAKLKDMESLFKKTLKELRLVAATKFNMLPQRCMGDTEGERVAMLVDLNFSSVDVATDAYFHVSAILAKVQEAIRILDAEKPSKGRLRGDVQGFTSELARVFNKHLKKPSTYQAGPFMEVTRLLTGIGDPSRIVRHAIKTLR